VNAIIVCIEADKPLEPKVYVMQATGARAAEFNRMKLPDLAQIYIMNQFQSNTRQSILRILSETCIASRMHTIVTVEYPFELTMQLSQEFGVSICFDTGHVIGGFSGPVDVFEALEQSITNVREIHLYDGI